MLKATSSSPTRSEVLQEQIVHANAMIALCRASNLPNAEVSYRAQLARLTQELREAGGKGKTLIEVFAAETTKPPKQVKKDC
jgi:hypothetical protein